jgi:hypothetical protein
MPGTSPGMTNPLKGLPARTWNFFRTRGLSRDRSEDFRIMLVERGLQVMNIEVVGDAYAIAANFLRKTGAIGDGFANERLLEIVVQLFQRGEYNKLRLANRAIARFEKLDAAKPASAISMSK